MAATNHDYDLSCAPLIMVHDFNHDYFGLCAHVSRPEALELPVRCVRIPGGDWEWTPCTITITPCTEHSPVTGGEKGKGLRR